MIRLGCSFQQVVPEGLVLPRLGFAGLLELFLNLQLLRLQTKASEAVCFRSALVRERRVFRYLETLGLLSDLHDMLPPQLSLSPLVVLQLVGELCLVLGADQLGSRLLDGPQVPELQLLHGLVMPEQHGVLQVLLRLPFVQFLKTTGKTDE